jgi:cobalt-zinc-cadmium efflux system outer membrane protein
MPASTITNRRSSLPALVAVAVALFFPRWASAQTEELTRVPTEELTRARTVELVAHAPKARSNAAQVDVAQAAVTAAGVTALENPVLSATGGLRFNEDGSRPFAGTATLSWPIEIGGKRGTRRDAASAELREAQSTFDLERRRLLTLALLKHAEALRAEEALRIARARKENAERVLASALKRRQAGSVPQLDVSLATLQLGRDAASASTAEGHRDAALLELSALLGLASGKPAQVSGPLVPEGTPPPLEVLLKQVERSAPVRAAEARLRAAEARMARERSAGAPTLSLLAQYERDDGANIGTLGVALPLPILNANALGKATSSAEARAARAEYDAVRAATEGELRELYARYEATRKARDSLLPTGAAVKEAVALAARSYELGESDLASVLLVHREALEAEQALLEIEHQHAEAKILLFLAAGQVPR